MSLVTKDDLERLFSYFARYPDTTSRREDELMHIQAKCNELFAKDYNLSIISNKQGELCATYPLDLVIMESPKDPASPSGTIKHVKRSKISSSLGSSDDGEDKSSSESSSVSSESVSSPVLSQSNSNISPPSDEDTRSQLSASGSISGSEEGKMANDGTKLEPLFQRCRFARVRTRFPVPVILWNNKNICRSSTLSQKLEYMLQAAHNTLVRSSDVPPDMMTRSHMESLRNRDIITIKQLGVKYILDLMMENKKKKFGFTVCSSEKVDMHERYANFAIASIPYPGVEFFQEFNQRKHTAQDLHFDWDNHEDAVKLKLDDPAPISDLIAWRDYKTWDLVVLTKNYLRLMLCHLSEPTPDAGLLVHCISGWDRTPLFISLLRITLWADRQVHQSLQVEELLYLTVAYDWLLFSHQLYDRASRGEDIFYFCFYFLQFIHSPEFSVLLASSPPPTPTTPVKENLLSENERKEAADSNSNTKQPLKKTPSLDKFANISAKLNANANSLPNFVPARPAEATQTYSSSFTSKVTPSIPIAVGPAALPPSMLPNSPSPGGISSSFSLISSTPHSYKGNNHFSSASSSTNSSGNTSLSSSKSTPHSFAPSSNKSNGGISIPHSHGHSHSHHSHSHSHSHSHNRAHSHSQTPPMEISHHRSSHKPRRNSDSCDPIDCACGSWQMVSELSSFSDKHPHPHLHPTPPSASAEESDDDSTDSSSHYDPVDADFSGTSWDDGFFPHDMDPSRPHHSSSAAKGMPRSNSIPRLPPPPPAHSSQPPSSSDVKVPAQFPTEARPSSSSAGKADESSKVDAIPEDSRAGRLSALQHLGSQLYDQCCRSQAGNRTFLSRFLPRFV